MRINSCLKGSEFFWGFLGASRSGRNTSIESFSVPQHLKDFIIASFNIKVYLPHRPGKSRIGRMKVGKVGRFLFTPFSILRYERLGTSWLHKNLLDLPIQQERLGPRLTCKFFLGGVPKGGICARYIEQRRRVIHLSHNLTPIYLPTQSWNFADCLTRGVKFHARPGRNRGHIGVNHTRFSFLRQSEIGKFLVINIISFTGEGYGG